MDEVRISQWMSLSQAARYLGLSRQMVRVYCDQGKFRFVNTALGRLIDPASVEQFAQARAIKKAAVSGTAAREEGGGGNETPFLSQ